MFNLIPIFFIFLLPTLSIASESMVARLGFNDQTKTYEIVTFEGDKIPYIIDEKYFSPLRSLTNDFFEGLRQLDGRHFPEYFLLFEGQKLDGKFLSKETPRVMSGTNQALGVLTKTNSDYSINGTKFIFAKAYKTNGTNFNQESINSFIGKKVSVLYKKNTLQKNVITAIVPAIYTADEIILNKPIGQMSAILNLPNKEIINDYLLEKIYTDEQSQKDHSFRHILMKKENHKVKANDKALVITLSGRQGDSPGAIAGHLAAGIATVKDDLSLDIEIWNYYDMINEKFIMPGHNDYRDYFGNLTGGQANYRPTYTLVLYGVDEKLMMSMRDELGIDFYKMREESEAFGAFYNCATETVKALRAQGIKPKKAAKFPTHVIKKISTLALSPLTVLSRPFTTLGRSLEFSLFSDPARFLPRAAFDGYLKNLKKFQKKLNLTRIDYIFQKQTRSNRALGGASSNSALSTILGKIKAKEEL